MKKMLFIIGLFLGGMLGIEANAFAASSQRMVFTQEGESDASIAPVVIEIGDMTKTTREIVYVTEDVFLDIERAATADIRKFKKNAIGGWYQLTIYKDDGNILSHQVTSEVFFAVMSKVQGGFERAHVDVPSFILALAKQPK